jgi:hypothetical protein
MNLPDADLLATLASAKKTKDYLSMLDNPLLTKGDSNSTWDNDQWHWCSTGGIVFLLTIRSIYYWNQIQAAVAHSSTKDQLGFITGAGTTTLYIRYMVEELWLE